MVSQAKTDRQDSCNDYKSIRKFHLPFVNSKYKARAAEQTKKTNNNLSISSEASNAKKQIVPKKQKTKIKASKQFYKLSSALETIIIHI